MLISRLLFIAGSPFLGAAITKFFGNGDMTTGLGLLSITLFLWGLAIMLAFWDLLDKTQKRNSDVSDK